MVISEAANIGIASVSVVLWTGGLIVLQLCLGQRAQIANVFSPLDRDKLLAQLQTRITAVRAGMACTAFGFLGPLFVLLFGCSVWVLPVLAVLFGAFYMRLTQGNFKTIRDTFRRDNDRLIAACGFLLPTLAMLSVAIYPNAGLVAVEALFLDVLGYFILSGAANEGTLNTE